MGLAVLLLLVLLGPLAGSKDVRVTGLRPRSRLNGASSLSVLLNLLDLGLLGSRLVLAALLIALAPFLLLSFAAQGSLRRAGLGGSGTTELNVLLRALLGSLAHDGLDAPRLSLNVLQASSLSSTVLVISGTAGRFGALNLLTGVANALLLLALCLLGSSATGSLLYRVLASELSLVLGGLTGLLRLPGSLLSSSVLGGSLLGSMASSGLLLRGAASGSLVLGGLLEKMHVR